MTGWKRVHGVPGGAITAIAVGPGTDDERICLAGTLVGLFRSTDGGESWTPTYAGLRSPFVRSLALSPTFASDGIAAVGTSESGLHLSYDHGTTWQRHEFWSAHPSINAIAFSPTFDTDDTIVAATTTHGVYVSTNRGRSWNGIDSGLPEAEITALALSPSFEADSFIVVGIAGHGLWKSESGGETWIRVDGPQATSDVVALAFTNNDHSENILVAGYENEGLYVSIDRGTSWTDTGTGLSGNGINDLIAVRGMTSSGQVIAAQADGSIISTDNPLNEWHSLKGPDQEDHVLAIAAWTDNDDLHLMAGTYDEGILRTTNSGDQWLASNTGLVARPILCQAIHPSGLSMLIGTAAGDVVTTSDGGKNWMTGTTDIADEPITALAISPLFDRDAFGTAVVGTHARHTIDGGKTWIPFDTLPPDAAITSTSISPLGADSFTTALGGPGGMLLISDDRGASWTHIEETFMGATIAAIAFSPTFHDDSVILAAAIAHDASIVYRSADRGQSWEAYVQATDVFPWLSLAFLLGNGTDDATFAFATGSDVYFPHDGPEQHRNVAYVHGPDTAVRGLQAIRSSDGTTCYVAATSAGLFRSSAPQRGWQEVAEPLSGHPIQAIDAIAADDGTYQLVVSTINGEIWTGSLDTSSSAS
ncbi:MAG: hypothetical protein CL790_01135 [Chloroflexi bacterium]|nr:hypothetical protein [Chloroflexota bacterium]HCU72305.1 hypothetical protein [Chloroflexota bacterium]